MRRMKSWAHLKNRTNILRRDIMMCATNATQSTNLRQPSARRLYRGQWIERFNLDVHLDAGRRNVIQADDWRFTDRFNYVVVDHVVASLGKPFVETVAGPLYVLIISATNCCPEASNNQGSHWHQVHFEQVIRGKWFPLLFPNVICRRNETQAN